MAASSTRQKKDVIAIDPVANDALTLCFLAEVGIAVWILRSDQQGLIVLVLACALVYSWWKQVPAAG